MTTHSWQVPFGPFADVYAETVTVTPASGGAAVTAKLIIEKPPRTFDQDNKEYSQQWVCYAETEVVGVLDLIAWNSVTYHVTSPPFLDDGGWWQFNIQEGRPTSG